MHHPGLTDPNEIAVATAAVEATCITPAGAARRPPGDLVERLRGVMG